MTLKGIWPLMQNLGILGNQDPFRIALSSLRNRRQMEYLDFPTFARKHLGKRARPGELQHRAPFVHRSHERRGEYGTYLQALYCRRNLQISLKLWSLT